MSVAGSGKMSGQHLDLDFTDAETLAEKATDEQVIADMRQYVFSVPPRDYNAAVPFVYVKSHDGQTIALPHGYRLPLMWVAKYQWDTVCRALTDPDGAIAKSWVTQRDEYIYLSFVCRHLLHVATARHAQDGGMEKGWRCVAFDRMLTRLYKGYNRNRPEHLEEFVQEYSAKEYDRDVLKYDWKRWVMKDHFGVRLSEDEVNNGITDTQFMHNIRREDGKWLMDPIAPTPLQSSAIHILDDNSNDRSISALLATSSLSGLKAEPRADVSLSAPSASGPQKRRRTVKLPRPTDPANTDEPPSKRPRRKRTTDAATASSSTAKPSDAHGDVSMSTADTTAGDSSLQGHEPALSSMDTPDSRPSGTATAGAGPSTTTTTNNAHNGTSIPANERPTIILKLSGPTPSKGPASNAQGASSSSNAITTSPSKNADPSASTTSKRANRAQKAAAAAATAAANAASSSSHVAAAGPSNTPTTGVGSSSVATATRLPHQHHHHTRTIAKAAAGQAAATTAAAANDEDVHARALDLLVGMLDSRRSSGFSTGDPLNLGPVPINLLGGETEQWATQLHDAIKGLGDVCRNLEKRVAALEGVLSRHHQTCTGANGGGSGGQADERMMAAGASTLLSFNQLLANESAAAAAAAANVRPAGTPGTPTPRGIPHPQQIPSNDSDFVPSPSAALSAFLDISTKLAASNKDSTDVLKDALSGIVDQMVTMKLLETLRGLGPGEAALSLASNTSVAGNASSPAPAPTDPDQMDVEPKPNTTEGAASGQPTPPISSDGQPSENPLPLVPSTSTSLITPYHPATHPILRTTSSTTTTHTTIDPHSLIPTELRHIRNEIYERDLNIQDDIASLRKHQLAEVDILRRRLVDLEGVVFREYEERERERERDDRDRERFYQYQYQQERHQRTGSGSGSGVVAYHSLRDRDASSTNTTTPTHHHGVPGTHRPGTRPHSRLSSRAALTAERAMQQLHNPLPPSSALQNAQNSSSVAAPMEGIRASVSVSSSINNNGNNGGSRSGAATPSRGSVGPGGAGASGAQANSPSVTPTGVPSRTTPTPLNANGVADTDLPTPTSSEMGDDAPLPVKSMRKQRFSGHTRQLSKELSVARSDVDKGPEANGVAEEGRVEGKEEDKTGKEE